MNFAELLEKAQNGELTRGEENQISTLYNKALYYQDTLQRKMLLSQQIQQQLKTQLKKDGQRIQYHQDEISQLEQQLSVQQSSLAQHQQHFRQISLQYEELRKQLLAMQQPRIQQASQNDTKYFQGMRDYYQSENQQVRQNIEILRSNIQDLKDYLQTNTEGKINQRLVQQLHREFAQTREATTGALRQQYAAFLQQSK